MIKVLAGGCFDLIHYGHIVFLERAKEQGNHLVVALESDENVRRTKGDKRPIHTQKQRERMLNSLKMVDEVVSLPPMKGYEQYLQLVKDIYPEIIAVTDNDPQLGNKRKMAKEIGAKIKVVTPRIEPHSTTNLLRELDL